jgi:hypothetical protein
LRHLAAVLALTPCLALAQATDDPETVGARIAAIVAELEADSGCEIELHGEPRFESLSQRWFAPYSITGTDCDRTVDVFVERGRAMDVDFARRPNVGEVKALVGRMLRQVRAAGCRVSLTGEPHRAKGSIVYYVGYQLAGTGCSWVPEHLRTRGREYDIVFNQPMNRQPLDELR